MNTVLNIDNLTSYNLSGLYELSGDDPSFVTEILNDIVVVSQKTVVKMQSAIDSEDTNTLASESHKFKSTLNILQCSALVGVLSNIEEFSGNGNIHELKTQVANACDAITLLSAKLQQELDKLQA